jgi:UDP-N-acetylglucosamine 4,6-dehydratase
LKFFLGDVRDECRLKLAMEGVRVVFHCAALKHVNIAEYNPFEAMQTNILGTNNVINASIASEVEQVIITSSDKAVNPTSTMGGTKLLGERLFIAANHYTGGYKTKFACVRFGNVLNSNGSVLHIFRRQLEENKPLTITSTAMNRFIISMDHAVDLCLKALSKMVGGEIFVSSMGSCNVMSLAKAVSGDRPFDFTEIGIQPGEKIYEELVTESEAQRTVFEGNTYIILPDSMALMSNEKRSQYGVYDKLPRLSAPLRSDDNMLSDVEVEAIIRDAGIPE